MHGSKLCQVQNTNRNYRSLHKFLKWNFTKNFTCIIMVLMFYFIYRCMSLLKLFSTLTLSEEVKSSLSLRIEMPESQFISPCFTYRHFCSGLSFVSAKKINNNYKYHIQINALTNYFCISQNVVNWHHVDGGTLKYLSLTRLGSFQWIISHFLLRKPRILFWCFCFYLNQNQTFFVMHGTKHVTTNKIICIHMFTCWWNFKS